MVAPRHLEHAPIREGLVDIQFEPQIPIERIERFADALATEFPRRTRIWQHSFGVEMNATGEPTSAASGASVGVRLESDPPGRVLSLRTSGFAFSQLAPYKDWAALKERARPLWETFIRELRPEVVTRMAVRFINLLPLPVPFDDFSKYLTAGPNVPPNLPQGLSAFLQRVVIVDPAKNLKAIVTQALEESQVSLKTGTVGIFLDIDTFRVVQVDAGSQDVWATLDELRDFKNAIFFDHITEEAAELFR